MAAQLVGWKAFYDDGSEYSSKNMKWSELPPHGLLVVVEFYSDGTKQKHYNKDYYILDVDKLYGTNDLAPYLAKIGTIKYGRWCSNAAFANAINKADEAQL